MIYLEIWFLLLIVQPLMLVGAILLLKGKDRSWTKSFWRAVGLFWLVNPIVVYLFQISRQLAQNYL